MRDMQLTVRLDPQTVRQLDRIEHKLNRLIQQGVTMTQELDNLDAAVTAAEAAVTDNTTVEASAVTLLDQLAELIRQNATDPAALQALADRISSSTAAEQSSNAALAAAITANTPAAPTPEPTPEPAPAPEPDPAQPSA